MFPDETFAVFLRFAKYEMRRIVSEVKFFTTVFSVFQDLEKPTWLSKKKKIFFGGGFCPFGKFCQKTGFLLAVLSRLASDFT
jgi:hypothetical protein